MMEPRAVNAPRANGLATLTFEAIVKELRKRTFAVLSTVGPDGRSHSVGIEYGVFTGPGAFEIYVMTRRQLKKARDIASNPNVSFVVPLTRRLLWFLPPPCIQFEATAEVLDRTDLRGIQTFRTFFMGRRILKMYDELESRGETRPCFLRITPAPVLSTYMVGHSLWELSRRMEVGMERVEVPASYRSTNDSPGRDGSV